MTPPAPANAPGLRVLGIDFTSAPTARKPVTCTTCRLEGDRLTVERHERIASLAAFEALLWRPGPWLAGLDFPFSFARGFLQAMGWPTDWPALADRLSGMEKPAYLAALAGFRQAQPPGRKHRRRALDRRTGGAAPNNEVNPPVARMLFEGVPRLRAAGLALPGLAPGDAGRRAVEAYPAIAAKTLIGTTAYKDGPPEDRARRHALRRELLGALAAGRGLRNRRRRPGLARRGSGRRRSRRAALRGAGRLGLPRGPRRPGRPRRALRPRRGLDRRSRRLRPAADKDERPRHARACRRCRAPRRAPGDLLPDRNAARPRHGALRPRPR
jgi:hypothetical protein